jgi:hypothetical protein
MSTVATETNAVADRIAEFWTEENYSGYGLAKPVNASLKALDIKVVDKNGEVVVKQLPPQMFYTYTSDEKQYIKTDENRRVSREDGILWLLKYLNKHFSDQLTPPTDESSEVQDAYDALEALDETTE